nr:MAG TPA: hypothetical protein [Bacteriophage sp.]
MQKRVKLKEHPVHWSDLVYRDFLHSYALIQGTLEYHDRYSRDLCRVDVIDPQ